MSRLGKMVHIPELKPIVEERRCEALEKVIEIGKKIEIPSEKVLVNLLLRKAKFAAWMAVWELLDFVEREHGEYADLEDLMRSVPRWVPMGIAYGMEEVPLEENDVLASAVLAALVVAYRDGKLPQPVAEIVRRVWEEEGRVFGIEDAREVVVKIETALAEHYAREILKKLAGA